MLKVLLVDSDPGYLQKAEAALSWHDISVQTEQSAQGALKRIWQDTPHVIVAAIDLPLINGWTFCRLLRAWPSHADLPLILLADEPDSNSAVKAFQLDADDYLPKTITFTELAARLRKRARRVATVEQLSLPPHTLTGKIGKFGLAEVLQFLAMQGESWSVIVTNGSSIGQILLARGIVLQAVSGYCEGLTAFHDLLSFDQGTFLVEPLTESVEEKIGQPLENLLLEIAASTDELTQEIEALQEFEPVAEYPSTYQPAA